MQRRPRRSRRVALRRSCRCRSQSRRRAASPHGFVHKRRPRNAPSSGHMYCGSDRDRTQAAVAATDLHVPPVAAPADPAARVAAGPRFLRQLRGFRPLRRLRPVPALPRCPAHPESSNTPNITAPASVTRAATAWARGYDIAFRHRVASAIWHSLVMPRLVAAAASASTFYADDARSRHDLGSDGSASTSTGTSRAAAGQLRLDGFRAVIDAANARSEGVATIGYCPAWAACRATPATGAQNDVPNPTAYAAFVKAATARYADGRVTAGHVERVNLSISRGRTAVDRARSCRRRCD
jgi:hypothetical protein